MAYVVTGWSLSAEVGLIKSMCWASYRGFPRLRFPSGCSLRRNSIAERPSAFLRYGMR